MVALRRSAGILMYRRRIDGDVEVLLGHMGGPFWSRRGAGAWSIPKGEIGPDEDPLAAACREFHEEIGVHVNADDVTDLGEIRQAGGKVVRAWAVEGDLDTSTIVSNTFELEWPPKSGRIQTFPEIDRAEWFDVPTASEKIIVAQRTFLDRLSLV